MSFFIHKPSGALKREASQCVLYTEHNIKKKIWKHTKSGDFKSNNGYKYGNKNDKQKVYHVELTSVLKEFISKKSLH